MSTPIYDTMYQNLIVVTTLIKTCLGISIILGSISPKLCAKGKICRQTVFGKKIFHHYLNHLNSGLNLSATYQMPCTNKCFSFKITSPYVNVKLTYRQRTIVSSRLSISHLVDLNYFKACFDSWIHLGSDLIKLLGV